MTRMISTVSSKQDVCAVVLAAGRGRRMNSTSGNKVTVMLAGKPIIARIVNFIKNMNIHKIIIVVGFAQESVKKALAFEDVIYAEQTEQLGTGDALLKAFEKVPNGVHNVFVVYGDGGVFNSGENEIIIEELFNKHMTTNAPVTFLTIEQDDPSGLGRIVRDAGGSVKAIVEEKDANENEKKIREINPGCFIFSVEFLNKYLYKLSKSKFTGEFYLTELIELAIKDNLKIETVQGGKLLWRGVNTQEELDKAQELMLRSNK